jgi:succinate dehydrogenase/fumarate reductase flavoprotein subunit
VPQLGVSDKEKRFNFEWINVLEFMNLLLVGEGLVRNALMRTESRGLHDRWDYSKPDPNWLKNIHLRLTSGEWEQWTTPVEFIYWKPGEGSLGEPWSKAVRVREYIGWRAEPLYKGM